jgi:YD repeat-containing protein
MKLSRTISFLLVLLLTGLLSAPAGVEAGQERYEYDALGRLVRIIDAQGRVIEYVYDAAGNLLQVITGAMAQAPAITAVTPNAIRRGNTVQVQVTGSNLNNVTVTNSDPGLGITNLSVMPTQVSFTLAVSTTAMLGLQSFTFTNAVGSATATITINPVLPKVFVAPAPLAIPPDNIQRQFTIRLSNADTIAHDMALSVANTVVAAVSPASLTIPAGQTEVLANVTGKAAGQTVMTLASSTLGNTLVPIFVTTEFTGINTSVAALLGVVKEQTTTPSPPTTIGPVLSSSLGVVFGNYIQGLNPKALTVGTGPTDVVISGAGLASSSVVSFVPPDGLTLGAVTVNPDGQSITVPVTVAANAPTTLRQVVVTASGVRYAPASPDADRLLITFPPPVADSIAPLFATPGSTVSVTVRGRNFQNAQPLSFSPSAGITSGGSPSVSSDGTSLTTTLAIAPTAPIGARTVIVTTPGGVSDATPSSVNTFTIVNEIQNTVTPIISATLGVVKETTVPPTSQTFGPFASVLGVSVGSVATGISPTAKPIGESFTLTVQGFELQGVTAVQFSPNTGITVGTPTIAADGRSLTVPVTLALDAPQTLRTVRVLAGAVGITFSDPAAALFRVTPPPARLDSISPIILQIGAPLTTLTARGANFQNASQVKVIPPDNLTITAPSVSSDGTTLTVSISAAAGAAPGDRAVVVVTPAGETTAALSPANTLTLTTMVGSTFPALASTLLGVVKETSPPPPTTTTIGPIESPLMGVVVESMPPPASTTTFLPTSQLGVTLGAVATSIAPNGIVRGSSGTLTIIGVALSGVTGVALSPPDGITLGALTISPDGLQVSVPITVAANAAVLVREVVVTAGSSRVNFSDPKANRLGIGAGVPQFDSITPILATQGQKVTLTVRGSNFQGVAAVTATPPDGIQFSSTLTVDSAGTIITIDMVIAPDAPTTSRVIQVVVPGAVSSPDPVPANTFTVFPP